MQTDISSISDPDANPGLGGLGLAPHVDTVSRHVYWRYMEVHAIKGNGGCLCLASRVPQVR